MSQDSTGSLIIPPRSVATGSPAGDALENVNTNVLANGVMCYVASGAGQGAWQLEKGSSTTPGASVVAPLAGPGRWFLKLAPGPAIDPFTRITTGRFAIANPGTNPVGLSRIGADMPVAADRAQVGGPAIVFAQWSVNLIPPANGVVLSLATTTGGPNSQGATVPETQEQGGFSQSFFYAATDPDEEVWITAGSSPDPPILSNGFLTIVKMPLS